MSTPTKSACRRRAVPFLLFALALIASACGGSTTTSTSQSSLPLADDTTTEVPTTIEETTTSAEETTTTTIPETTTTSGEGTTTTENTGSSIDGKPIYTNNCALCHAGDGSGGRGPSLIDIADRKPDMSDEIEQITNGGGGMRAFGDKLSEEEILAVIDYYRTAFSSDE